MSDCVAVFGSASGGLADAVMTPVCEIGQWVVEQEHSLLLGLRRQVVRGTMGQLLSTAQALAATEQTGIVERVN